MRRLVLVGFVAALPLAAVAFVWAAADGGARRATLDQLRDARRARALPAVHAVVATQSRVSFIVTRPGGVEVTIRDGRGRFVRRLGHFTVAARRRLVLTWDGAGAPAESVAVVTAAGKTVRVPVRRLGRADDADRQSLRKPGNA